MQRVHRSVQPQGVMGDTAEMITFVKHTILREINYNYCLDELHLSCEFLLHLLSATVIQRFFILRSLLCPASNRRGHCAMRLSDVCLSAVFLSVCRVHRA